MDTDDQLITQQQLAKMLGRSPSWLSTAIFRGTIPAPTHTKPWQRRKYYTRAEAARMIVDGVANKAK